MPDQDPTHVNVIPPPIPTQIGEQIDVQLRPHIGTQQTRLGPVQVEHAQYIILAGRAGDAMIQVGYVGKHDGAPINWLRQPNGRPWPGPIKIAVREAITSILGGGIRKEAQPPEPQQPEPDDDDLDLDD